MERRQDDTKSLNDVLSLYRFNYLSIYSVLFTVPKGMGMIFFRESPVLHSHATRAAIMQDFHVKSHSVQFSSVPRPIGSSGDVTNDSIEMLFRSFLPEAIVSSSLAWAGMSTL